VCHIVLLPGISLLTPPDCSFLVLAVAKMGSFWMLKVFRGLHMSVRH